MLGGIFLGGPSVFGQIPGFTATIFPAESTSNLNNVANRGPILFLFIIGLEVDLRYLLSDWKVAFSVSSVGLIIPFALDAAISYSMHARFKDEPGTKPIAYGTSLFFIGVAVAITTFLVLCRTLTELKLLSTPVGIITLASGVSDDVVGWVLLASRVALVHAGIGLVALYILLCAVGW